MNRKTRVMALLLSLAILVQLLPVSALAATQSTESAVSESAQALPEPVGTEDETETGVSEGAFFSGLIAQAQAGAAEAAAGDAYVVGEEQELRGEEEKHFRMSDGTFRAVAYAYPVHYLDEDETWQDIDNTLVREIDLGGRTQYVSENGAVSKRFAGDLQTGQLFETAVGDYRLSLSLVTESALQPVTPDAAEPADQADGEPAVSAEPSAAPDALPEESTPQETAEEASASAEETTAEAVEETTEETIAETTQEPAQDAPEATEEARSGLLASELPAFNRNAQAIVVNPGDRASYAEAEPSGRPSPTRLPETLQADVCYQAVYPNVDLVYTSLSHHIKESIVLHSAQSASSYVFQLNLRGLTPEFGEDGAIRLLNEAGEEIYLLPAPYMFDAAGAVSDAVSYRLEEWEQDTYLLCVEADAAWLSDTERTFPVTIDPTVIDQVRWSDQGIAATYVYEGQPATAHPNYQQLDLGWTSYSSLKEAQVFFGWNSLPEIPNGCEVVSASVHLYQTEYSADGASLFEAGVYAVEGSRPSAYTTNADWITNLTWNSRPTVSSTVLDYAVLQAGSGFRGWDITQLVKSWYRDDSLPRAACIKMIDVNQYSAGHTGVAKFYGYGKQAGPLFVVAYRNMTGVEPYYSYQTMAADAAGAIYLSDYTGAYTSVTPLVSFASAANPVSVNLIYNSAYFITSRLDHYPVAKKLGLDMYLGSGFRLDIMQKVEKVQLQYELGSTTTKAYLKYTDGDGTEHYFATDTEKDSTGKKYYDEDGLGMTAEETSTGCFLLYDDQENEMVFYHGFLTTIRDANDNEIRIYYTHDDNTVVTMLPRTTGARIAKVVQANNGCSEKTIATFSYATIENNANTLQSITDYAGNVYRFDYSCYKLRRISRNGTAHAVFVHPYDSASNRFVNPIQAYIDPETGCGIHLDYTGDRRVLAYYEVFGNYDFTGNTFTQTGTGAHVTASHAVGRQTIYRFWGADRTAGTGDDTFAVYAFDSFGRTVNVVSPNAEKNAVYGVTAGSYTQNAGTNKKNNRVTAAASAGVQGQNLLYNSGMEGKRTETPDTTGSTITGWSKTGAGGSGARVNCGTSAGIRPRTGSYLLRMYLGSTTAGTATRSQTIYLTAGKSYVFSGYVNTAGAADFGTTGGAYLSVKDTAGQETKSRVIRYKTNPALASGWERLELTFTAETTGAYSLCANMANMTSIVVFDDFQLEEIANLTAATAPALAADGGASSQNLLQLSGFESRQYSTLSTALCIQYWNYSTADAAPTDGSAANRAGYVLTFADGVKAKRRASQTVALNQSSNTTFLLSGWGLTPACRIQEGGELTGDNSGGKRFFGMIAKLTYQDTTTPEYHYVSFHDDIGQWQYASGTIVPKRKDKTISAITVILASDYNANRCYMDDISLTQEPVQTYSYDADGKVTLAANGEGKTSSTYDASQRLTKYTSLAGVSYSLSYAGTSRNPQSVTSDSVVTSYTYNAAGAVTSSRLQSTQGGVYLASSAEYSADQNYKTKTTDTNGAVTQAAYHAQTGLLTTSTAANGTQTSYTYDGRNRVVQSQTAEEAILHYAYSRGALTELARGDGRIWQIYRLTQNAFGQTTKVAVQKAADSDGAPSGTASAELVLAAYEYAAQGGNLTKLTYGNGQQVAYSYDLYDRTAREVYRSKTGAVQADYRYVYNANGELARQYAVSGETYQFAYDSLGRLIRSMQTDASGAVVQRTEHLYDTANRLTKQSWTVGDSTFTEHYAYRAGDGSLQSVTTDGLGSVTLSYDSVKRLSEQLFTTSGNAKLVKRYVYSDNASTQKGSTRPLKVNYYLGEGETETLLSGNTYVYTTDGNISRMWNAQTGKLVAEYAYDALGRLTQEKQYNTSGNLSMTYTYTYDLAGNLLKVKKSGGKVLVSGSETEYLYENESWPDLLTSYDGKKIAYEGQTCDTAFSTVTGTVLSGNPINWYNGTKYTGLTWQQGRRLTSLYAGNTYITYAYDMNGVRSRKTVGGVAHDYVTQNGRVIQERYGTTVLQFVYGTDGNPYAMRYSQDSGSTWQTFYYILNLQGDVVKLVDNSGAVCAEYSYDAWGKCLSQTTAASCAVANLAEKNPIRYRGYYYDAETGWYYLQSRYYDPIVKRFINADSYATTPTGYTGCNMFAYCNNNPVACADDEGTAPWWVIIPDWGYVHRLVQDYIVANSGIDLLTEQRVYLANGKTGRVDLLATESNEIWEVKFCGPAALGAEIQLNRYLAGTLYGGEEMRAGEPIFEDSFIDPVKKLKIWYWSVAPGIILYDFALLGKGELESVTVPVPSYEPKGRLAMQFSCSIPSLAQQTMIGIGVGIAAVGIGMAIAGGGGMLSRFGGRFLLDR